MREVCDNRYPDGLDISKAILYRYLRRRRGKDWFRLKSAFTVASLFHSRIALQSGGAFLHRPGPLGDDTFQALRFAPASFVGGIDLQVHLIARPH